jgi:hypothetical protein
MATGTWNQGQLEKRVTKIDLENYPTIKFHDSSLTSDGIFDIIEFPSRFTAGKNLIKLRANNSNTLVKDSKIHIEILDSNGDPVYFEPLNYLEHDGTRVISIYIFPKKTAPGIGKVYIAGRSKIDVDTGAPITFSRDFNNENYYNLPNVLWSRSIPIAPENSKNNTEIIFTRPYPKAAVRERVNKFFKPVNLTDVAVNRNGTGTVIIKALPAVTQPAVSYISAPKGADVNSQLNYEGAASPNTPMSSIGKQVVVTPAVTATSETNEPLEVESAEIVTISAFSRLETVGFSLSSSMEGGSITIVNPFVDLLQGNSMINDLGQLIPSSQATTDQYGTTDYNLGNTSIQLSGSYTFVIDTILSTTKANVFLTSGFKNVEENTYGAFSFKTIGAQSDYIIKDINATLNFTCSYTEPFVLSETEQSQSFAEIVLSNIEPATGDVYKIQTLYKPAGQFGDFVDAGYVNIEQVEILEDVTSYENIQSIGMVYNRIGYFTSLSDFSSYWETTNGSITPDIALTTTYKPDILLDAVQLIPDTSFNATDNRFGYLHLKSEYHPKVYENTRYMMSLNAFANDISGSDHSLIQNSRLDIYISGSNASIQPDSEYINRYLISDINVADSIPVDLADNGSLGIRVATIEATEGTQFNEIPALISFKALKQENIDVYFVVRSGVWALSNISLKSDKQTGFSPNYTRINTRIPTEFLETPLTFKFLYYDINNNKAQAETSVYPVTFYGDNLLIGGNNNLLSGSVFIGNTIGSGIELAGVNSGYIRSIGYEGFKSASRTDQPGGFMLYTGSVLPSAPDNYAGVGIEIVQDSSSYFKFDTTNGIDVRAKKFFVGTTTDQFVSGSGGNIEISSSNFHLKPDGGLVIGGDTVINADLSANQLFVPAGTTASNAKAYISSSGEAKFIGDGAGDYIVDFSTTGAKISGFEISSSEIKSSNDNLRLKSSGQITGSDVKFTGGKIGGFTLSSTTLAATNFTLDPGNKRISLGTGDNIFIADGDDGIQLGDATFADAPFSVTKTGTLKATSGTIGGWTLASDRITGGSMIIRDNGTIESDGFVSNLAGSGFRLTAASGGFLEVENARIRGTLSTAVFEKETVNAVGGQLYVANSTTLTGSIDNPAGAYAAADTTMSVVNVTGFTSGEILSVKKINSTGFQTEYLKIDSASRKNSNSETDFSGKIYVTRSYGSGIDGDSGSLGNTPGGAQSYTGSQVIVSTGKLGTGYIRLNANPNDQATPYIQIVERTGSGIYDLDLKAQLGDLSGITDNINGTDVTGFGLYTDNAFLKGGIVATYGSIGALNIGSQSISIGNGGYDDSNTKFFVSSSGKFSLGEKFVWDGTNLTIEGSITLTNASDFVQPSQTGSITDGFVSNDATSSLLTSDDTGSLLTAADTGSFLTPDDTGSLLTAAQTSSLENPATYAFGGDDGFTLGTHTVNTGLNMNSSFLGYFNGTTPKTFMSSSGDFYLGGTGGAFKWDESEGSLLVSGSLVSMNVPTFYFGGTSQFISGANGNIEISSSNFHLNSAGDVNMSGTITSTAGVIGGFTIDGHSLTSTGVEINDSTQDLFISSSDFKVTHAGDMSASNADFDGFAVARSLRQKTVTITQANMHQYCVQLINGDDSNITFQGETVDTVIAITTKLMLDGSLGGEIISHVIIDVDLLSEPPEDSYFVAGELISLGLGTQPSSNFQRTALGSEYFDDGTDTISASGAYLYKSFGGIREIIGPTAVDGTKVPVTIEIGDTANVDFYVPIGNAAANSAFGIISQRLENQMAIISPVLREEL